MLANILAVIDVNIVSIALPDMLRSFHGATLPQLSWVINGYTVFFAAALLPAGGLADRFGSRRVFLTAVTVFSAGSLACALAPSVTVLVATRMLQALGGGAMITMALAIGLGARPGQPTRVLALISGTAGLAAAAAPTAGGLLLLLGGWRAIFFAGLPVAALVLVLGRAVPPPERRTSRDAVAGGRPAREGGSGEQGLPDIAGILAAAGGVGMLALLAVQAPAWGWLSLRSLAVAAAGAGLVAVAVIRSLRHPRPAIDLTLLRSRSTAVGDIGLVVLSVPQFCAVVCATLFLIDRWGFSPALAAVALSPGLVASSAGAWLGGRLVRKFGPRRVTVAAGLTGMAGWLWIAGRSTGGPDYAAALVPGLAVGFLGIGAGSVAISTIAVVAVPQTSYSRGSALVMLSRSAGAAVGLAGLARLLAVPSPPAFRAAWVIMAAAMTLMAGAALLAPG